MHQFTLQLVNDIVADTAIKFLNLRPRKHFNYNTDCTTEDCVDISARKFKKRKKYLVSVEVGKIDVNDGSLGVEAADDPLLMQLGIYNAKGVRTTKAFEKGSLIFRDEGCILGTFCLPGIAAAKDITTSL